MAPDDDFKDRVGATKKAYILWAAGLQLAISIMIGFAAGLYLDRWLGTAPLFILLFIVLGVASGFLNIYRIAVKNMDD